MKKPTDTAGPKKPSSSLRWIILIPFVIVLGVMAAIVRQDESNANDNKSGKQTATTGSESSEKKEIRKNIKMYVYAGSNEYDRRGLGGISNLEISVNNASDYPIDKVRVKIMYIKANGSVHEVKYEDFHAIKPNSKATHKIPDTKRGISVKYEIATIKSKALGLS
ncbi:hypothetical protein [Niastella sp. OAS944]|uniref:hypothetical protein n=1 Tax=Niastella sp. OAS944 TaxID=2664089 RepID=UPI00347A9902|nr:hypothetical protein [Chitinophagaceae bacterium OAS944]